MENWERLERGRFRSRGTRFAFDFFQKIIWIRVDISYQTKRKSISPFSCLGPLLDLALEALRMIVACFFLDKSIRLRDCSKRMNVPGQTSILDLVTSKVSIAPRPFTVAWGRA